MGDGVDQVTFADVQEADDRIDNSVRRATVARIGMDTKVEGASYDLYFALEFMQHTGSFKARGAQNFIRAHREQGSLPDAGVTIASGGNAGLACAWAAQEHRVPATVFLPETAPQIKVDRLRSYGLMCDSSEWSTPRHNSPVASSRQAAELWFPMPTTTR